ncbi:uncharacterized protein [Chanodichthys erythropterus]|uniref:uncharacterized protein isoform X2 n=1 Tax=Chanodichthys erythropterus TaxID=933992 RepID=UPI00351EFEBB
MDTPREPQGMEEESVTDTESESESAVTLSSTGSESLSENDTEKRGPSSLCTPSKKRRAKESSQYLSQNQSELVVTCGDKKGVLYLEKFNDSRVEKCIFSEGQWFKPTEFERFGGKERNKKWKISICCGGISLQKLIENGRLSSIKKRRVQNEQHLSAAQENSPGSSPVSGRLRRRQFSQCRRQLLFSSSDGRDEDDDDDDDDDNNDDDNDNDGDDNDDDDDDDNNDDDNNDGDDDDDDNDDGADELNQFSLEFSVILDSSSDESISVAERDKLNRREFVNSTETVSKQITEPVGSTVSDRDSPARPVDPSEPGVSPVVEEAVQTTDDPTGAAQLSFSASPDERQNPVASEETQETRQLQLYEFLTKQFNTINNTLQSIDLSLKKLVEKQSHDTLSQYIRITPGENSKILALVKQESLNL